MPRLLVRSETGVQTSHDLVEETIAIGRGPENAIRLNDPSVSNRHAEVIVMGTSCYLKDLGSTNGTFVNGQPVTETSLRAGDRIRFGKIEASYQRDPDETQRLSTAAEVEAAPITESSVPPVDFQNASPFPRRKKEKDSMRRAVVIAIAIAIAAFVASMVAVFLLRTPGL